MIKPVATLSRRIQIFHDSYPYLGPALWILSLQYFVAQVIVAHAWRQPFSVLHNTISDLGNTACGPYGGRYVCSPLHGLMNLSFVALGLTMFFGAGLIYHEFRHSAPARLGFSGMALAGAGTVLVGLFPENTLAWLHATGALLPFLIGNVSIGILGARLQLPAWLRFYSVTTSVITLVALVLYVGNSYGPLGSGGAERLVSYPQSLWLIIFGLYISRNRYLRRQAR